MNAVLQSLLGLEPFAEDLLHYQLVKAVHPNSLYRCSCTLSPISHSPPPPSFLSLTPFLNPPPSLCMKCFISVHFFQDDVSIAQVEEIQRYV